MRIGEMVRMAAGPFVGMYATIVKSLGHRLVLAVVCGDSEVLLEIDADWVIAGTPCRRSISRIPAPTRSKQRIG